MGGPFDMEAVYRYDAADGIWRRPAAEDFDYSDGEAAESYLMQVLANTRDCSCASDELLAHIRDWPSAYHFSPTRHNLLRGLRLGPRQRILEVGAGCGAITRYLGESGAEVLALEGSPRRAAIAARRCRDLDNVRVLSENFARFESGARFDVATLIGVLEYAPRFFDHPDPAHACLQRLHGLLADDGALIVAIENRFGLKYFNGAGEDHTNRLFDSINDLYPPRTCRTWGRAELAAMLRAAGFARLEFLYPFPDYKLPKFLVREAALAHAGFAAGTIVAQYPARDYIRGPLQFFSERLAWPLLADNGLLPHLANSFLVLAYKSEVSEELVDGDWLAQAYATDRRACFRRATSFVADADGGIRVAKRPVHTAAHVAGPLAAAGDSTEPYREGEPCTSRLQRLTFSADAYGAYLDYLRSYLAALAPQVTHRAADARGFTEFMPADRFDCIPPNLLAARDGTLHAIDQEWRFAGPVPLLYLLFRAIYHDFQRIPFCGSHAIFAGARSMREFIHKVCADLGRPLTAAQMAHCVEIEGSVFAQVEVQGARRDLAAELDRPPQELVPLFTDAHRAGEQLNQVRAQHAEQLAAVRAELAALRASRAYRVGRALATMFGWPLRRYRARARGASVR